MIRHDPERHELELIELLGDDVAAAEAAFEASSLAECDVCREIAREHLELARKLDGLGGAERVAIASSSEVAVEEGRAERALRELIEQETGASSDPEAPGAPPGPKPRRSGAPRLALAWIAAAAAVLVAVFFVRGLDGDGGPVDDGGGPILGPGDGSLSPDGEVEDFSTFTWTHERPKAGWFVVVVESLTESGELEFVFRSPRLGENRWAPPREEHEAWPDRIVWELEVYSGATPTDVLEIARCSAWRSPR